MEDAHRAEVYSQVRLRTPDGPLRARVDPLRDLPTQRRDDRTAQGLPPRGAIGRFFADLGWRAYAVPLLVVATMITLVDLAKSDAGTRTNQTAASRPAGGTGASTAPTGTSPTPTPPPTSATKPGAKLKSYDLPGGAAFTQSGDAQFDVVPGTSKIYGTGNGPLEQFTVEVEQGITGVDQAKFAAEVEKILGDPRGWGHGGRLRFQRVDAGFPDFKVSLTTPLTLRSNTFCGFDLKVEASCYNRNLRRVVINLARWVRGAVAFKGDMATYHAYAITHETGHALNHSHQGCSANGALAPPMMEQTLGLTSATHLTCKVNPWPYPTGDTQITGPSTNAFPLDT